MGCGTNNPPVVNPAGQTAAADAGAPAPTKAIAATTPSNGATPTSKTPIFAATPAFVGSKKVTKRNDPAWATCHASFKASSKDVSAEVAKLAQTCAAVTTMKQVGATMKATQDEGGPHQEFKLKAAAGHCYRVYVQSDATIKDLGLMIKDSAGDTGSEDSIQGTTPPSGVSETRYLVQDGVACFKEADDAFVVVTVGQGKGNYALQIWGD